MFEELNEIHAENKRLRWLLSQIFTLDGKKTRLEEFHEINPDWIDAMIDGGRYPMPDFYKEVG